MKIIVQKFGGTSLNDESNRAKAVRHILKTRDEGFHVVVVVSAMGREGDPYATDTLLNWIRKNGNSLSEREQDLLLSCGEIISSVTLSSLLQSQNVPVTVLTGLQAGIITDASFGSAQIIAVHPQRILNELALNKVVIVCGFQGGTEGGEITTLGRGGSDTTAAALGVALKAQYVDIFTDVEGIMTADPHIVHDAIPITRMTYQEVCHLAYQGAKVIHPRAVELAMQAKLPLRVRSTLSDQLGTLVTDSGLSKDSAPFRERIITGITYVSDISQIKVRAKENDFNLQLNVFKAMAENKISVDFINVNPFSVVYTVENSKAEIAESLIKALGYEVEVIPGCAKVAVVGAGMAGRPGIMAQIVEALTQEEIQIIQSADSHTTIWVLIQENHVKRAINALHKQFKLNKGN
jgi:aspartate kinase